MRNMAEGFSNHDVEGRRSFDGHVTFNQEVFTSQQELSAWTNVDRIHQT
jgi:hypothetical protein